MILRAVTSITFHYLQGFSRKSAHNDRLLLMNGSHSIGHMQTYHPVIGYNFKTVQHHFPIGKQKYMLSFPQGS